MTERDTNQATTEERRELPLGGVYTVCMDPDITGIENILWSFASESDADDICARMNRFYEREDAAWVNFEPVAFSLFDADLLSTLEARFGDEYDEIMALDLDEK